jgi:glycosyltransferase involved in cell wall biosynthesis
MAEKINDQVPTVSIGMPVYNGEKYIREALDSLLAQTFGDFELIISDNHSTDDTRNICKEYAAKDSRIKYVRQDENIGALANFKFVLNNSSAKYFMWAAFDDKWSRNWIEVLLQKIDGSHFGAVFGRVVPVDLNLKPYTHIATSQSFNFDSFRFWRKIKFYLDYEGRGKANLFYSLFNRSMIKKVNLDNSRNDYSILYDSMSEFAYTSVENAFLYKRNDTHNEGIVFFLQRPLLIRVTDNIFPLPIKLLREYLYASNWFEKVNLIVLLPIKICIAYYWIAVAFFLKQK